MNDMRNIGMTLIRTDRLPEQDATVGRQYLGHTCLSRCSLPRFATSATHAPRIRHPRTVLRDIESTIDKLPDSASYVIIACTLALVIDGNMGVVMAKYAFAAYTLKISPSNQPERLLNVSDIDGRGTDLIHLIHGFLRDVQAEPLRNNLYEHYLSIEDVSANGRCITFTAEYGKFGLQGNIKNVRTNEKTHQYGEDESPVIPVRHMVVVPTNKDTALFFAERCGNRGAATMFLTQLLKAFRRRFADQGNLMLRKESLTDERSWQQFLERARLTQIKVVRYDVGHDLADGLSVSNIGDLEYTIKPVRTGALGKSLMDRLLNQTVKVETQILGLRDGVDADEVRLKLTDGEQQRSIVLGDDNFPTLVYPIRSTGDERPSDDYVYKEMNDKIEQLARDLLLELPSDWMTGAWDAAATSVRLKAVRDGR
ncbi:hypothetical protein [Nonomuraea sp. NPDC050202]|uniref:hypothetical protein n=1 Tax=Nonomuraea sp. NPDC050202 TaxID=3155035 RepID=UPI0034085C69